MVDSVTKRYKLPSGYEVEALGGISLELIKGEMLAVSMGGSNEFVECFCWGAVAEGGSGAVVQFVGDGVEVGLVAGDGAPLARETMFSVVAWGLARGEACSALCVSVYRCLISLMLSFVNQWCSSS